MTHLRTARARAAPPIRHCEARSAEAIQWVA
jgi:hypothetical protein